MTRKPAPAFLCLCLGLLLMVFGVQTAGACPGQAVMAVAACGHDGVIWLDAQGQPAKPCAHCPDCLASQAAILPGACPPVPRPVRASRVELPDARVLASSLRPTATARGPPARAGDLT